MPTGPSLGVAAMILSAAAVALAGCDKEDGRAKPGGGGGASAQAGPATANATGASTGKGVIRGVVKFSGTKPEPKPKDVPCHGGATVTIPDESVIVPPGTYQVGVWHEKLKHGTQDVSVDETKPTAVTVTITGK